MSDAAAATPAAKSPKKRAAGKPKKPSAHPKYSSMIKQALVALKERGGASRQALLKYIMKHFNVGKEERLVNARLKVALRAGVKKGTLKQSKGHGASGSFKIGEKKEKVAKPKKPKVKKAKKPKKAKKAAGEGKAKKAKKTKKPKAAKAKKPKAVKPKKPKTKKPKAAKAKSAKK